MAAALAILGAVGAFLGPAIEAAKLISAPVRRQCSYLCCFYSNIKALGDEAGKLDDEASRLQAKVDAARNNARVVIPTIEAWLRSSDEMKIEKHGILNEARIVGSGFSKRYSLSKKAKKATKVIRELVERCKFSEVSSPPAIAATDPVQLGASTYEYESRRQIEEEIMKSLGDKNVNKIGICGMGGLGKTTMARKIMNGVLKKGLLDEAVMAVVSQPVNKMNIQLQIGEQLGVKFEDETLIPRANILRKRLRGAKKTLLVLDDVWETLDTEELGIPCEDVCKVLITSRSRDVMRAMDVEKVCELKILDEEEAWHLLRGKAGTCVDAAVLNPIAKDVMRECKGLPLALSAVGLALKDEKDISIWKDALGQLRRSNPSDIPSIIEQVYNSLKLSYDRLGNQNAMSMFLLCCLFPEDYNISLNRLTYFAAGLHLFHDIWEMKEVRGRTSSLVKMLKNRGLLLDGNDEDHVRMHDVARDVSIFIASTERRIKCSDCTWISSHVGGGTRHGSFFPKLKLLLINGKVEEQDTEINEGDLIGGSMELNVLDVEYGLFNTPPLVISLTALALYDCHSLKSIAVVGQMKSLEILVCSYCNSIKELPEQVRGLKRLKLLQISDCFDFKRVADGVISSMVALEELKIVRSFKNWKGAGLREIESLKKLSCLEIEVSDIALAAQPLRPPPESLVQFMVQFGRAKARAPKKSYGKRMSLDFEYYEKDIDWGVLSTNIFLTRTESLSAVGNYDQEFNLNLASAKGIRWLTLSLFGNKKNIASAAAAFPLLEYLSLTCLHDLEKIWDDDAPIPSNSFTNLKHLNLESLWALKRIGKCVLSTAKDFFLQLETIEITYCKEMEHLLILVPTEEERDEENHIKTVLVFPKLKTLRLDCVPKLRSMICSSRGIESIQFPQLSHIEITDCVQLKCLVSRDDDDHYWDDDDSLHIFCHPKVSFGNLQTLILKYNNKSKNVWCDEVPMSFFTGLVELKICMYSRTMILFSSSIAQNLVNLQKLEIEKCVDMLKVIEDEEEVSSSSSDQYPTKQHTPLLFPSLQEIRLLNMFKLESFCEWRRALELPSLTKLEFSHCNAMKSFISGGSLSAPALQTVIINGHQDSRAVDDLNAALQHQFEKRVAENVVKTGTGRLFPARACFRVFKPGDLNL